MYLGFNYDVARGRQAELLRWADEQRMIRQVREARRPVLALEAMVALSAPELAGSEPKGSVPEPAGQHELEERRAS